jgi:cytochrome P450
MMQSTGPPRHRQFRVGLDEPFAARSVPVYAGRIRAFAREAIQPGLDGEVWDAARAFVRLPIAAGAMLTDLPPADIDPLLRLAYASLAPPRYLVSNEIAGVTSQPLRDRPARRPVPVMGRESDM